MVWTLISHLIRNGHPLVGRVGLVGIGHRSRLHPHGLGEAHGLSQGGLGEEQLGPEQELGTLQVVGVLQEELIIHHEWYLNLSTILPTSISCCPHLTVELLCLAPHDGQQQGGGHKEALEATQNQSTRLDWGLQVRAPLGSDPN